MKVSKIIFSFFLLLSFFSCNKRYKIIDDKELSNFIVKDTLLNKENRLVLDLQNPKHKYTHYLLLKTNKNYLFISHFYLEDENTILDYEDAFLIDEKGSFRENGLWVYTKFTKEGSFPFTTDVTYFSVDSIPSNFKGKVPTEEGIYFYKSPGLVKISTEQSNEKFKEKRQNGFYFFPNSGRLFNRIKIDDLD